MSLIEDCLYTSLDLPAEPPSFIERHFFGRSLSDEQIHRAHSQFIFQHVSFAFVIEAVLASFGKVGDLSPTPLIAPIPKYMHRRIRKLGVPVNVTMCSALFGLYCTVLFFRGMLNGIQQILLFVAGKDRTMPPGSITYRFPDSFLKTYNPSKKENFTIIKWIMENLSDVSLPIIHQSVSIPDIKGILHFNRNVIAPISSTRSFFKFSFWLSLSFVYCVLCIMSGRGRTALLFYDAVQAKQMELASDDALASHYLFSTTNIPFRPLWTHIAQSRGSDVILINYSTNQEGFERQGGRPAPKYEYAHLNWSTMTCWDDYQSSFFRRVIDYPLKLLVLGPVWTGDSDYEMPDLCGTVVAYFDVQPFRPSFYDRFGFSYDFFVPRNAVQALSDLISAADSLGAKLVYKRKRDIGKNLAPKFARYLETLNGSKTVVSVDPEMAAQRLIEHADAVVSMPWTSTALIARNLGKPSCYYDPTGKLQPDDSGAHGIPVLQTPQQLQSWLKDAIARRQK